MTAVLATRGNAHWIAAFDAAGVPAGPVHSIGEALEHSQAQARGMVVEVEHAEAGRTRALGCPLHFSATPTVEPKAAPALGQHSQEVLREYGYADDEIRDLVAAGAVA
jgi:crotonobetainyl-CoA:carnitine CoA-transferase CaiB-like acyl-CoA transferase